ncbi:MULTISPECIES: hypothetical protein [unclassified Streptomyces]|uniref:hypothetical protein n=1 Tax=unclassified Streptomyces TaxID=2593676 RepID=UPI001F463942|nr:MULTISPECIES: hypothetical protein [unclassified Streptomyces]
MEEIRKENRIHNFVTPQTNNEASGGTFHGPVIMGGQVQFELPHHKVRAGTRLGAHEQMFSHGEWVDLAYDPVPDAGTGDYAEDLSAAGFHAWFTANGFADGVHNNRVHDLHLPLNLVVYERHDRVPRFALLLTGNADGTILTAYAAALPDLMVLLAQWTPTLRMLAQTDQIASSLRK